MKYKELVLKKGFSKYVASVKILIYFCCILFEHVAAKSLLTVYYLIK